MTRDPATLREIVRIFIILGAIATTSFPILYSFAPWYASQVGRVLMLKALTFALLMDIILLFQYWRPKDILVLFWIQIFMYLLIALQASAMSILLIRLNFRNRKSKRETAGEYDDKPRTRRGTRLPS
jgi:hypothetical protein